MSRPIQVMKFGGTSVGDASRIRRAAAIAAEASKERAVVVVVSAMSGVTNALIAAAGKAATGDEASAEALTKALQEKHHEAIGNLISDIEARRQLLSEIDSMIERAANYCRGCALLGELSPRALDVIAGTGERLTARMAAAALREMGLHGVAFDATDLIVTDDVHGGARPLAEPTRKKTQAALIPLLEAGGIPVVTGYIAATTKGIPTTLGRGGSDYSATILGAALDASEVIIWTDVNGVLTADPRMVPDAATLDEVSYTEAGELAFFGAKVLHPMTLRPVIEGAIPVWIRNSFQPELAGTKITHTVRPAPQGVKAVTATRDVAMIAIAGPGIIGVPDIAARIFTASASVHANIVMISQSSSQDSICFVVRRRAPPRPRAHQGEPQRGHRRGGRRKHGWNAGHRGARLQHARQGIDQHHRHRARFIRVQHFFPGRIGRNGEGRESAASGLRPRPPRKRRWRADRRSADVLSS
jgi:aspartate kinase